jgi:hypothetical protein
MGRPGRPHVTELATKQSCPYQRCGLPPRTQSSVSPPTSRPLSRREEASPPRRHRLSRWTRTRSAGLRVLSHFDDRSSLLAIPETGCHIVGVPRFTTKSATPLSTAASWEPADHETRRCLLSHLIAICRDCDGASRTRTGDLLGAMQGALRSSISPIAGPLPGAVGCGQTADSRRYTGILALSGTLGDECLNVRGLTVAACFQRRHELPSGGAGVVWRSRSTVSDQRDVEADDWQAFDDVTGERDGSRDSRPWSTSCSSPGVDE